MITEAGGHHCPSPTLQTGVCKSLGFFTSSFFISPETGWGWKSSQIPSRCPLGSQCLVSSEEFWSQSQVRLSIRLGPGIQNLCFRTLAHWESVTSRMFFFFSPKGEVHYILPSIGRKEAQCLATHRHCHPRNTQQLRHPEGQTHFGNEAPPEAQGVNSCTKGCVL